MWTQFFLSQSHFILHLITALVFVAIAWLYFDAWKGQKRKKEGIRSFGFLFVSLSFIISAVTLERTSLEVSLSSPSLLSVPFFLLIRTIGYTFITISLLMDPVQPIPKMKGITGQNFLFFPLLTIQQLILPLVNWLAGVLFILKATKGLEKHLLPVGIGLVLFALSELVSLRSLFNQTTHLDWYTIVTAYGPLWIIEHVLVTLGMIILARWIFGYLVKRIETQLIMILTSMTVILFFITTVTFTGLLVNNVRETLYKQLTTDAQVFRYAIESEQEELTSKAIVVAQDAQIVDLLSSNKRRELAEVVSSQYQKQKLTSLIVTNKEGVIQTTGENKEKYGTSLASDIAISRGLKGETFASFIKTEGVLTPVIHLVSIIPIKQQDQILGVIKAEAALDTALLDGVKKATGLEASIYTDDILSATTLNGQTQSTLIGMNIADNTIRINVLKNAQVYTGELRLANRSLIGSFIPIQDVNNIPIGMINVSQSERIILDTATKSIEFTFIITTILLIFSLIPAYLIAQYIRKQIK